jgi:hypothetical protein
MLLCVVVGNFQYIENSPIKRYPNLIARTRSTRATLTPLLVSPHIPSLPRRARVCLIGCCVFICHLAAT